ncbi:hypothetical protein J2X69_000913 [Algoriphagus sp. 4150]|nr:hypothetical protein [Algoriphagus sp. 4150]
MLLVDHRYVVYLYIATTVYREPYDLYRFKIKTL